MPVCPLIRSVVDINGDSRIQVDCKYLLGCLGLYTLDPSSEAETEGQLRKQDIKAVLMTTPSKEVGRNTIGVTLERQWAVHYSTVRYISY